MIATPPILTVRDATHLGPKEVRAFFHDHVSPGQLHYLKILGFQDVLIEKAEGMYFVDKQGRSILDLFGAVGALGLGHNHPRILGVRKQFADDLRHDMGVAFLSQYAVALARSLALIAPGQLDMVHLGCTGSEAIEVALKLVEKTKGPSRNRIAYAAGSFHGKTRGALSVSDSPYYHSTFALLANCVRVPFGDAAALEDLLSRDHTIGGFILETVQGGAGIITPPNGYLRAVRQLCDRKDVLWIADEIQCGMGRTGRFFAFEHDDVAPDIVTLAKTLGGGKAAVSATITRSDIYLQAFGSSKTALIQGPSTFSAMGEACCTALETLNILYEEGLIDNAALQGAYLLEHLRLLGIKHSGIIRDVRGQGLMIGIEIADISRTFPPGLSFLASFFNDQLQGTLCGILGALLFHEFRILVGFTIYNRNVMRLEPPFIIDRSHADMFISALDDLCSRGIPRLLTQYARCFLSRRS